MKVHPRNAGTSTVDLVILAGMPIATAIIGAVIYWLAMDLQAMSGAVGG